MTPYWIYKDNIGWLFGLLQWRSLFYVQSILPHPEENIGSRQ